MAPIPTLGELPAAPRRIVLHWTAGAHTPNDTDRRAYHYLVHGDGTVEAGQPVAANMRTIPSGTPTSQYAAHVRALNSFSVGIALCGMAGAREGGPYGSWPLTEVQVQAAMRFAAECCLAWGLDPSDARHLLSHAEVPRVYDIAQPGKWDIAALPFAPQIRGSEEVGTWLRQLASAHARPHQRIDIDHIPRPAPQVIGADDPPQAPALRLEPQKLRPVADAHIAALASIDGGEASDASVCRYARATGRWGPLALGVLRLIPGRRAREARGWLEVSVEAAKLVEEHCDRAA
jgi:hypothetical protein